MLCYLYYSIIVFYDPYYFDILWFTDGSSDSIEKTSDDNHNIKKLYIVFHIIATIYVVTFRVSFLNKEIR